MALVGNREVAWETGGKGEKFPKKRLGEGFTISGPFQVASVEIHFTGNIVCVLNPLKYWGNLWGNRRRAPYPRGGNTAGGVNPRLI